MAKSNSTEKPRWLKEREETDRNNRFPTQPRTPIQSTLEQKLASKPVEEGVGSDGGVSLPYNPGHATIAANGSAAQSGSEKVSVYNHVPKWVYTLITAGLAVLLYAAGAVTNTLPTPSELVRQWQPKPAPTAPAARATPTTDRLATIKNYQPELAQIIESQPWFADGINQHEQAYINKVGFELGKPNAAYLADKLTVNGNEKPIAVIYDAGLENVAKEAVKYLQEKVPKGQEFFGLPISWTILTIELHKVELGNSFAGGASNGGIATILIKTSDFSGLEDTIGHEGGGHLIIDQDGKGRPVWYGETSAEIGNYFSSGGEETLDKELANLDLTRGKRPRTKPLSQFSLDDHLGINGRKATSEHITEGLDLLLRYRKMVGHSTYQTFVNDVDALARTREINNEDIREKMLLHAPEPLKTQVGTMYNAAVFGK